jgi:hypothetical protein
VSRPTQGRLLAFVIALLVLTGPALAQSGDVDVRAYIQPQTDITDVTQIRLVLEVSGAQNPQVGDPQITGLENLRMLRSRPSIEQSASFINGRVSSSYRLNYVLLPEGIGPASIPGYTLTVNGKTYETAGIRFEVKPSPKRPEGDVAPAGNARQQDVVFAEASLSDDTVWVGEPVVATASVYSTLRVHDISLAENPTFSQFLSSPISVDVNAEATRAQIEGRAYVVYPMRRDLLIPLGPGNYEIPPYTLQVQVQSRRDAFDLFARGTNVLRKTEPLTLKVKALPPDAPAQFGGAIGEFEFRATLDRTEAAVNDAVALRVVVEGPGSLETVDPPVWEAPQGVKVYDPESKTETDIRNGTLYSRTSWEWVLVPLAPANLTLDDLEFTYFDPRAGEYRTKTADPLTLAIVEGEGLPVAGPSVGDRSVISLDQRDISFIKSLRGDGLAYLEPGLHQRWWFVSLALSPLAWGPFLIWVGRRRELLQRDLGLARGRRARRRARKALSVLRRHMTDSDAGEFHEEVARALVAYVGDRFNRSPSGLTYDLADELLAGRGVADEVRRRFRSCLETCDFARFVPSSGKAERRAEVLDEALALIDTLERAW